MLSKWIFPVTVLCCFYSSLVNGQDFRRCPSEHSLPAACQCSSTGVRCLFAGLTEIPRGIPEAAVLLDLRFNKIARIDSDAFTSPNQIETLLLGSNVIHQLGNNSFALLKSLKSLWINGNGLSQISPDAFRGLTRLESLHLESNRIALLDARTFASLRQLQNVFLQQNSLTTLPPLLFAKSSVIKKARVDGNPLHCDCEILWLKTIPSNASLSSPPAECATPPQFQGFPVFHLTPQQLTCAPPHFVREPEDVELDFGQSTLLDCAAVGDPLPVLQWMHDKQEINPGVTGDHRPYAIMDDGRLQVSLMSSLAEGTYQCMAKNPLGEAMGRMVTVRDRRQARVYPPFAHRSTAPQAPVMTVTPQSFDVRGGETISLQCEASGLPLPTLSWKQNGVAIQRSTEDMVINPAGTLRITRTDRSHNGEYECTAANSHGSVRATARVRVRIQPRIIEAPKDSIGHVGGKMTIRCRADGFPAPSLSWLKNGVPTPTTFVHDISRDGSELTFLNITLEDAGTYRCFAQNSAGTASASAQLSVREDVSQVPDTMDVRTHLIPQINAVLEQARDHIDSAEASRAQNLQNVAREILRNSPETEALRAAFDQTLRLMEEKIKRGMVFDNVTEFTYNESIPFLHVQLIANLSGCAIHRRVVYDCSACYHKKYRTFDGTCNNIKNPMQGASFTGLRRILPPSYSDGLSQPAGTRAGELHNGFAKPSARLVSTQVLSTVKVTEDQRHSHMLMQWGQFLDHDLSFTVMAPSHEAFTSHANCKRTNFVVGSATQHDALRGVIETLSRSTCDNDPPCFPIPIPPTDSRLANETCMEFIRSRPVCGSGSSSVLFGRLMPREQINSLTSYIDASMIYGSSEEVARHIRDPLSRGLFRSSLPVPGSDMPMLPYNDPLTAPEEIDCKRVRHDERNFPCFTAGEIRVNEQLGLLSMHTLWFREHNRIAEKLGEVNPQWSGEKVFQETRKIIAALIQHITYDHWLPKILGNVGMQLLGGGLPAGGRNRLGYGFPLKMRTASQTEAFMVCVPGPYAGYKENIDASIANSFATAALRMGHSTIFPVLRRLNGSFETIPQGDLTLQEAFFAPHRLFDQGGIDPILRGLFGNPAKLLQKTQLMNTELTEKLFGMSTRTHRVPLDLGAFNIQRGRDHGLPSYVAFRRFCNLVVPDTFADLRSEMDAEQLARLERVYGHPGNVDLFAGAMSERPLPGAKIGKTFMCLLVEQFKRLRDGDRFWYEKEGEFSSEQLKEIKAYGLPKTLCDNTDTIDRVQRDIFLLASAQGGYSWCEDIPSMDLTQWKECCEECYLRQSASDRRSRQPRSAMDTLKEEKEQKIVQLQKKIERLEALAQDLERKRR